MSQLCRYFRARAFQNPFFATCARKNDCWHSLSESPTVRRYTCIPEPATMSLLVLLLSARLAFALFVPEAIRISRGNTSSLLIPSSKYVRPDLEIAHRTSWLTQSEKWITVQCRASSWAQSRCYVVRRPDTQRKRDLGSPRSALHRPCCKGQGYTDASRNSLRTTV